MRIVLIFLLSSLALAQTTGRAGGTGAAGTAGGTAMQGTTAAPATPQSSPQQALPGPQPGVTSLPQQALPGPTAQPPADPGQQPGLPTQVPSAGFVITTPTSTLGVPGLTTPTMSLDPPPNTSPAGASNATGTLLPGATNATLSNHPTYGNTEDTRPLGRIPFDRGAAQFTSAYGGAASETRSLGEIAAEMKTRRTQSARTITNEDIQRVAQQPGVVTGGGLSGTAVATPPTRQTTPQQDQMPVVSEPAPSTPAPQTTPRSEEISQAAPPPQIGDGEMAQTQSAPPDEPAEQVEAATLPAASTSLPAFTVMGLLAGVAGILCRR